jgi:hypothetical protein
MPINNEDIVILKLSKGIKEGLYIQTLIEELRNQSIEMLNEQNVSLKECYQELTNEESSVTLTVYRHIKN